MFGKCNERFCEIINVNANGFLRDTQKRILNAYLHAIIISRISETSIVTAADIISNIKKRYDIRMSPGTVYPALYKLEGEGNIKRLPNRKKKIYVLTQKGHDLMSYEVDEILIQLDFILDSLAHFDYIRACLAEIKIHNDLS